MVRKFLAPAFCLLTASSAHAEKSAAELEDIARSYRMSKEELLESEAQKRRILASLYQINRNVKNISKHKTVLTDELLGTQARVQRLSKNIVTLEGLTDQQREKLKRRLRVLYKFSGQGFLKSLFANSSFLELDRFLKFMKIISERDYHLILEYQRNIKTYRAQKEKLTKETQRLLALKTKIKVQEDKLTGENQNTQRLLAQVDASRLNQLAQLRSLRSKTESMATSGERVDAALLKMMEPSFFEQKGGLSWPVVGAVTQKFGYITDEEYQYRLSHKGLFVKTAAQAPVSPCFQGTVVHDGALEGYGKTIIIDHGHHYYTVYANLSEILVKTGDKVDPSQRMAKTGMSPDLHEQGLYFELRHFSEPEDPSIWLKKPGVQISKVENEHI